ncbi:RNA polymerase factor sigma-54 [Leptolyngbya sp. 7M]|uniref:RNA polymerase factor sigma-54 n=1 Tax=Leptolyngbya sp. 7M TaxID=2812896 RepID=UPI001B8C4EDE|nr:RNA polymerase factor sigma-54 [Leptolyngbya sp. 7M]QYO65593.1 RNA polymerase factor sigma-54 [Leptolyngbya sp. 7M]
MSSLRLTTQLQQRMVLTPQLRQRIEMLQMTSMELQELIEQEMVANPVLEEVMPGDEVKEITDNILDHDAAGEVDQDHQVPDLESRAGVGSDADIFEISLPEGTALNGSDETSLSEEAHEESGDSFEEIDFGREFQDYLDPGYKTQEIEYRDDAPSFEQFLSHSVSLSEHLEWQLNLVDLSAAEISAARNVIGNLDEDGRLSTSVEEIAGLAGCDIETAERGRKTVMSLDPVGCGALDVKECILAQLEATGESSSLAAELVRDHLEDLQPHRLQHLAKATGKDLHELNEEIGKIRLLDPYPGRRFSSDEAIFVAPEVYIEKVDDEYVIYFVDDGSPRLRISPSYHQLLGQDETSKETKDFIKEKVRSAVDLLRNIEHRRQTIYRVVECIVQRQREFLDKGVEYLKPMMLKDVAEDIGMHLSTISRVVNRKYAHTPQGVIELRRFFSEGMMNEEGEEVSTRILKLRIKKLVEEEDSKKPLTDEQIVKILSKEGVKLSRRTVAKYRDQMNIPGSRERKTVI